MQNNQKIIKLKIQLTSAIFLLVIALISGFFVFGPELSQIARALTGNYSKSTGDSLDNTDWNNLNDDFVAKSGDTMAGPLILPADPTANMQAATKQYVDSFVGGAGDIYTNWGSSNCPVGVLLYSGNAFGIEWTKTYGSGNVLCLESGDAGVAANLPYLDGVQPLTTGQANYMPPGIPAATEVFCAVCYSSGTCFEIDGTDSCPAGFSAAYTGYIMGGGGNGISENKSDRHCVNNTAFIGSPSTVWGGVWYGSVIESIDDVAGYTLGSHIKCAICCN